jgi:lipopolysaccharide/colanic/teichoic acid biosynthesis glycosyltransferase
LILKRLIDLVGSVFGLLLLTPFMIAIAIWIRADSAGPVFFRQQRVGRNGRLFRIHKFRTMAVPRPGERGQALTIGADTRITRAGAVLRNTN